MHFQSCVSHGSAHLPLLPAAKCHHPLAGTQLRLPMNGWPAWVDLGGWSHVATNSLSLWKNMFKNSQHCINNKLLIIILILRTAFMVLSSWKSQYDRVHPFHWRTQNSTNYPACLLSDQANQLGVVRLYVHSPSPFSIYSPKRRKVMLILPSHRA